MVSLQFSYCPSGNDHHDMETTLPWCRKPQLRALVCMVSPQFSYCPSGNDHHCVRKPQLRVLVCMVSPQFSYCPSGNDNHWRGNHNSGPWYVWYHHSSVTVRPVTTTTAWGNHNSGSWYVWYHHSSVTVRPVTTTTTWKPQLRVLVCMVSLQFSYCPSGNDNHETTTPCIYGKQFSYNSGNP